VKSRKETLQLKGDIKMAATNPLTQPGKQKITAFLWFDNNAEEAANFYVSVFKNSRILETSHYTEVGPGPKGSVMVISFELDGQKFTALNGGPQFKFTEAISLLVNCESQEEVDYYWNKLTADGGQEVECGWVKDKYGLSWQIVPEVLMRHLTQSDPATVNRVMQAMMQMKKLDIKKIEQAASA
jgi:predicted 3-demethylubiquinone-9 3-methyltransferase (glyoxalase superfamily)